MDGEQRKVVVSSRIVMIKKWAKELNIFPKKTHKQQADMKSCSASLIIKEMQIKTTVRYFLTLVRMTIIKKDRRYMLKGCGEKESFAQYRWGCKLVHPLHGKQCGGSPKD